jgi:hypothetical protein
MRHGCYAGDESQPSPSILALTYVDYIATSSLKTFRQFVMALLASFYVCHSMWISHLRPTGEHLLASTASGTIYVLDLNCRHTESSSGCEHYTTIEVGEMWDFDCHQNTLITANHNHLL